MGSKVEYILLTAIAFILATVYFFDFKPKENLKSNKELNIKESEINDFIEYEINSSKKIHTLKAKNAYKIGDTWYIKEPKIKSDDIKELRSKEAIYSKEKIIFKKSVKLIRENNSSYSSQKAIYLPKKGELITPDEFNISKNCNCVTGENLIYNTKSKEAKAKNVKANIKLKEAK